MPQISLSDSSFNRLRLGAAFMDMPVTIFVATIYREWLDTQNGQRCILAAQREGLDILDKYAQAGFGEKRGPGRPKKEKEPEPDLTPDEIERRRLDDMTIDQKHAHADKMKKEGMTYDWDLRKFVPMTSEQLAERDAPRVVQMRSTMPMPEIKIDPNLPSIAETLQSWSEAADD